MFDETGPVDFTDVLEQSSRDFDLLIASAGKHFDRHVDESAECAAKVTACTKD